MCLLVSKICTTVGYCKAFYLFVNITYDALIIIQKIILNIYPFFLIFCSTILFIVSDSLAADWSKNNHKISLLALFFIAPLGYIFFGLLNKDRTLATSSGIVNMGLLIGTVLVSALFFEESINFKQTLGISLALIAMYFLA